MNLYKISGIGKPREPENGLIVARSWEGKEWGVTDNGYRISYWADKNILELDSGDAV